MLEIENKLALEQKDALESLAKVQNQSELDLWKQERLGKTSVTMSAFGLVASVAKEDRPAFGRAVNAAKLALEEALSVKQEQIRQEELASKMQQGRIDVTLPGRGLRRGRIHPLNITSQQVYEVLGKMGFQIYQSPEVETDDFNFTYLNIPPHHPARDMWDTFYTDKDNVVLRTHTSPGQIHAMREYCPQPIRVILPGSCYRYEQQDQSHEIEFSQVELLAVDKGISFSDLKGTMQDFARRMFGEQTQIRLRPSYFPFTEPSAELDVECFICGGKGCGVCHGGGWLEWGGCGMVHPRVLEYGGYDPAVYSGFAAGMGIDRATLLRYQVDDIRYLRNNDIRFLEQF
ncbi:MAG: phenylalanine--tRNA ligase subunit alpha [Anaerolineaceae bacterium]|nr:phenylalanine--tRNA ligase subunit alpha [Anaerolineaceae bacterium]